jgi:hypothetical protein
MGSSRKFDDGVKATTSKPKQQNRRFDDASITVVPSRESTKNHKKSRLRESVGGFCCKSAQGPTRTRND